MNYIIDVSSQRQPTVCIMQYINVTLSHLGELSDLQNGALVRIPHIEVSSNYFNRSDLSFFMCSFVYHVQKKSQVNEPANEQIVKHLWQE